MRHALVAAAALAAGLFGLSAAAIAHDRGHNVCWGKEGGGTDCARIMTATALGAGHPTCANAHHLPKGCKNVEIVLTRSVIARFSHYFDTSTMVPGHTATLYPNKHHH